MPATKPQTALAFASRGLPVVPLHHIENGRCTCRNPECDKPGKHPLFDHRDLTNGLKNASNDPEQVSRWWTRWPEANIGLLTGEQSGIVVIDIDPQHGGLDSIKELLGDIHTLRGTLLAETGGGGLHAYYQHPGGHVSGTVGILPGVDIRGDGNYVVAPPGDHISGRLYSWSTSVDLDRLPELPTPLQTLIHSRNGSARRLESEEWAKKLHEGERNNEIARRAGKLLRSHIPPDVVARVVLELNDLVCDPPLPADEVNTIVQSVARREAVRRGSEQQKREQSSFNLLSFGDAFRRYGANEITWDVPRWLPSHTVGMVVAPPGSFKTWILADLATSLSGGRPFLGQEFPERTGPVIIVQQEDYMPALMHRIALILGSNQPEGCGEEEEEEGEEDTLGVLTPEPPIFFHDERQLNFRRKESVIGLKKKIEAIRPIAVLIDPLYCAVGAQDFMTEAAQEMMVLKALRDEFGCSFLVAHHTIKHHGENGRSRDDVWGSQFLNAWLETGWQMRPNENPRDPRVELERHFKVAPNAASINLRFNITNASYTVEEISV